MQNLERRPSGIYVVRLTIPIHLRAVVGATVFVASTGTRSLDMAKLLACGLLAGWRRQLFELSRLSLSGSLMTQESILKIADGHPLLLAGGHLPLAQAAAAVGLSPADLLRQAAEGRLALYCRLQGEFGYHAPFQSFEVDDPELGTVLVPGTHNRPRESRIHRAFDIFQVPQDDVAAVANELLTAGSAPIVAFKASKGAGDKLAFVPDKTFRLTEQLVEVSAIEVDALRRKMAQAISPEALEAARRSTRSGAPYGAADSSRNSVLPLSAAIGEYCRSSLPQSISSPKEIARIRNGLLLLAEFEGDLPIAEVSADTLRNFRDTHLAQMPAKENQVRQKYKTTSMTASMRATQAEDWPRMSERRREWTAIGGTPRTNRVEHLERRGPGAVSGARHRRHALALHHG